MDGRKSFVFSWNKKHREIHEEALLHYFDPSKKGQKFEYQPPQEPSSQTPQSARFTELEKAFEEDPVQQLTSLVSRIEIGSEMGNRTGARPKEGNQPHYDFIIMIYIPKLRRPVIIFDISKLAQQPLLLAKVQLLISPAPKQIHRRKFWEVKRNSKFITSALCK